MIGDDRTFHFFCRTDAAVPPVLASHYWHCPFMFGEFYSYLPADAYKTVLMWGSSAAASFAVNVALGAWQGHGEVAANTLVLARNYLGLSGSCWATGIHNNYWSLSGSGLAGLPNPVDGGLYMNALALNERGNATAVATSVGQPLRGRIRGIYQQAHMVTAAADQDTFSGVGDFAGRTFMFLKYGSAAAAVIAETSAWDSSS